MRSIRLAAGTTLAIARGFSGCGGGSGTTKDAASTKLDAGSVRLDSGGAMSDTSDASSLDSGAGDKAVAEGGIRDGASEMSMPTEVGPAVDLASVDVPPAPDAPTDITAGEPDSRLVAAGCPAGYHDNGSGTCVTNGSEGKGSDGGGNGADAAPGKDGGTGTDGAAGKDGAAGTDAAKDGATGTGGVAGTGWLGDNSTSDGHVPVQVSGLTSGVTAVAAGHAHTCAVVNGGVLCWGDNGSGQLGDNSMSDSHVPVRVSGLTSGVTAITANYYDTCAVVGGGARCWGASCSDYSCGPPLFPIGSVPVQVSGLTSGVTAIAAGREHTCAVVNGGAQCWGENEHGQLGDNKAEYSSNVPVQVLGLTSDVTTIAAGGEHTCAVVNGGAQCWGDNGSGQLGDNSESESDVPVPVQFP